MPGAVTCFLLLMFGLALLGIPMQATLIISIIASIGVYVVNRNDNK
jgi:hypothetical protein